VASAATTLAIPNTKVDSGPTPSPADSAHRDQKLWRH